MDDQKNFILAIVLSGLVMLGYWFFFGKPLAEQARENAELERQRAEQMVDAPEPTVPIVISRDEAVTQGNRIKIDTAQFSGSFNTKGTQFDDIRLKNYKATLEEDSESIIMLTPEGAEHSALIFDNWTVFDGGSGIDTPWELVAGTTLTETTPITLEYQGEGFAVERTITVDEHYLITLSDIVTNTSGREISLVRKGVSRQNELPYDLTNFFIVQEGPISVVDNKLVDMKYKKLKKERQATTVGEGGWVGLTDVYWLSAAIAPQGKQITSKFNYREINDDEVYEASYETAPLTLTAGTSVESVGHIFVGAKDRDVLINYEKELGIMQMERAIDWGAMRILTRPMSWALSKLGELLGNYGLGILALTLIIKIFMFPLFNKQYESQAKMKKVAPKQKKLQELYGDDRMKLQQEVMALYKKEGVNPMAGCLPIIPTIFVFFALYKSVFINVDLRHAPFFGYIRDLSAPDPLSILNGFGALPWGPEPLGLAFLAIGPLALLYGITMAMMQTLQTMGGDPMQQKIFAFMPWVFMFILAPFASGLLLYWVWNNVLSFIQQYIITRKFKVDTPIDRFFRKITGKAEPTTE
jgi:YidC/Oxa1 family membrane protein insertase